MAARAAPAARGAGTATRSVRRARTRSCASEAPAAQAPAAVAGEGGAKGGRVDAAGSERWPDFMPGQVTWLNEPAARSAAERYERVAVRTRLAAAPLPTGVLPPEERTGGGTPVVLMPGFDSSALEYRRLHPRLCARGIEAWGVDLVGWGFTGAPEGVTDFSPEAKRAHLYAFWEQVLERRPMVLCGASLGGAAAVDFAVAHPEAVERLVLVDAQCYAEDAPNPPGLLAKLGVAVLKSTPLRSMANQMSYCDKETYATQDAVRVGRLHCLNAGYEDAICGFMRSGGYSVSTQVSKVSQRTLILWGADDGIVEKEQSERLASDIASSELVYVDKCGHVPHLEQADETAERIASFIAA